jgi:hypothetical protein
MHHSVLTLVRVLVLVLESRASAESGSSVGAEVDASADGSADADAGLGPAVVFFEVGQPAITPRQKTTARTPPL